MSELLEALIEQRKHEAINYAAYLAKVVELTRQAKHGPGAAAYPRRLDTLAKRALYDNLDKDETLALAVHEAVYANRQDDWRNNSFKVKRVRNAIKAALKDDESATERVLELVKNQHEY
jgi:type I restriction enzyme, R subunit